MLGVHATPAFFINGERVEGALPYKDFKKILEKHLKKSPRKKTLYRKVIQVSSKLLRKKLLRQTRVSLRSIVLEKLPWSSFW